MSIQSSSLRECLRREPVPLQFGTSGRRGLLEDLSQLEIYLNALAELQYLQELPEAEGGVVRGEEFYFAYDLRPSSTQLVGDGTNRGELAQAIERAISDAGMVPVNLGSIPTPALTCFALARGRGSIMVTGSHIPFDRNGYKVNTAKGELLKHHEGLINRKVSEVRARLYGQAFQDSLFDRDGQFKAGHRELPEASDAGVNAYVRRYVDFFGSEALSGLRLLVYQHSAVGRDLLVDILRQLGAEVFAVGRSETFVPIDTENIGAEQLAAIQALFDEAVSLHGRIDAVVSTDGDSDRPLILGIEEDALTLTQSFRAIPARNPSGGCAKQIGSPADLSMGEKEQGRAAPRLHFFGGDLVGMITAEFLEADAVVVPISCNDGIDRGSLRDLLEPKTRIGSPYVIAGMEAARARGRRAVCGWEANGGFLTGSDIVRDGKALRALPTRDAVLPIVSVLCAARERNLSLADLFDRLPGRFSRAALIKQFPRARGLAIIRAFSPDDESITEAGFAPDGISLRWRDDTKGRAEEGVSNQLARIRVELAGFFTPADGFGAIRALNYTDGVRILFDNGDVAHLRPSGNADELRIYAVADTQERADAICALAVEEPDGTLRRMEKFAGA